MKKAERRQVIGWTVSGLGLVCVLWGVLHLTSATVGGRVEDFAHRRTYTEVKLAAHQAYPGALWRAAIGLSVIWLGARIRNRNTVP